MLKVFMVSQDVAAIEVEEKYTQWVEQLRTDRYVTAGILGDICNIPHMRAISYMLASLPLQVTIFQLEKIYGTSPDAQNFIATLVKGTP